MTTRRIRDVGRRVGVSTFCASGSTVVAGLLDGVWAERASGAEGAASAGLWAMVSNDVGVLAPLGVSAGIVVGLASALLWPERAPSPRSFLAWIRAEAAGRHASMSAFTPLAIIFAFLWMTLVAQLARLLLNVDAPAPVVGFAIAASAVGCGVLAASAALALTPPLRTALARLAERKRGAVDPVVTGSIAVVLCALAFAYGIWTGSVSGQGGPLGIYGIFKRPELDLRAAALALAIAGTALLAASALWNRRGALTFAVSLLPLLLTVRASSSLQDAPELSQALERGAPLGRLMLGPLRRVTDRDGDGASGAFGGGDCDDANPGIHPRAEEVLDNGIDEDCSGADLTKEAIEKLAPAPVEPSPETKEKIPDNLNVMLISIDTLRWDLGYAGYERPVSPNIDALAARATIFERAYALASYTGKSIGPMLIGKYGSETNRNWGHFNKFSEADTFVAERLKAHGMRTMAVHGHRYFDVWGGLERGFDVLDMSAAPPKEEKWAVSNKTSSEPLTDAAIALLKKPENSDGRFFMWVHYLDPHADYLVHRGDESPDFGLKKQRDVYDGEVAYTDYHVGRLLSFIEKAPWGERTAIIITSDHGEAFGEHGMTHHGFEVWDVLVRVPLVVYVPGAEPRRVKARRSLIDLVPTILGLTKVPGPGEDASETDFLSGVSLLADVFPEEGAEENVRDIFIDMPEGPYNDRRRALIHEDLKLTVSNEAKFELFDLAEDPDELKNLAKTDEERLRAMKERYAAFKARLREVVVKGKRK